MDINQTNSNGGNVNNVPELEGLCTACDGDGKTRGYGFRDYTCGECEGAGYVPTEYGKKFVEFIRHQCQVELKNFARKMQD